MLAIVIGTLPWPGLAAEGHPRADAKQACVAPSCHAASARKSIGAVSVHEPFSGGECVACHDLALTAAARYVKGAPPGGAEDAAVFRGWDQALCSGCHGEGPFAGGSAPGATAFADGKRNLHALHAQAGRGRRCLTCHEAHASRQARLLRELLPARGSARITQEFRGEPQGGWCRTGCHAPKGYRR